MLFWSFSVAIEPVRRSDEGRTCQFINDNKVVEVEVTELIFHSVRLEVENCVALGEREAKIKKSKKRNIYVSSWIWGLPISFLMSAWLQVEKCGITAEGVAKIKNSNVHNMHNNYSVLWTDQLISEWETVVSRVRGLVQNYRKTHSGLLNSRNSPQKIILGLLEIHIVLSTTIWNIFAPIRF